MTGKRVIQKEFKARASTSFLWVRIQSRGRHFENCQQNAPSPHEIQNIIHSFIISSLRSLLKKKTHTVQNTVSRLNTYDVH